MWGSGGKSVKEDEREGLVLRKFISKPATKPSEAKR